MAGDVVGRDARLLAGRAGQWHVGFLAADDMLNQHRVADGINVLVAGLHVLVDHDRAARAQLQPGILGQGRFRTDADGEDDHVGIHAASALQGDMQIAVLADGFQSVAQRQPDVFELQMLVHHGGHFVIDGRHHLVEHFDDGHLQAAVMQVLGDLQADESAPDHDRAGGFFLQQIIVDVIHVSQRAQRVNARQ